MNQEMHDHIMSLTDGKDYGLCAPPMDAQIALSELARFFLGDDWCCVNPMSQEQINTEIVAEIETRYEKNRQRCYIQKQSEKTLQQRNAAMCPNKPKVRNLAKNKI